MLVLAHSTLAFAADRLRLVSVSRDIAESDQNALDNQYLDGLYQGDYGGTHMSHNFGGTWPAT